MYCIRLLHQAFWLNSGVDHLDDHFFDFDILTLSWLKYNACDKKIVDLKLYNWGNYFLFGIWYLWIQRNKLSFNNEDINPDNHTVVEKQVLEFIYCV